MAGGVVGASFPASKRQTYQARLLVVELDAVDRAWLAIDVPGITLVGPLVSSGQLATAVIEADMVVLLAEDLAAVSEALVIAASRTAAEHGRATAAVITALDLAWTGEAARRTMATIRDEVDTVLILEDVRLAAAFVDVLRGGRREPA